MIRKSKIIQNCNFFENDKIFIILILDQKKFLKQYILHIYMQSFINVKKEIMHMCHFLLTIYYYYL